MEACQAMRRWMAVGVAVTGRHDGDRWRSREEPVVIRAVLAAVVVNLVHVEWPDSWSDLRLHIHGSADRCARQIPADFGGELPIANHGRQAQAVLVLSRQPVAIQCNKRDLNWIGGGPIPRERPLRGRPGAVWVDGRDPAAASSA